MTDVLIRADSLVTAGSVFSPGGLLLRDGTVAEVGPWGGGTADLTVTTVSPGLVDVHNHGGGGASFAEDPDVAIAAHRRAGSTTLIASLVTEPLDVLEKQIRRLVPYVRAGELAGIHLEGPWLSEDFHGAHPVSLLRDPHREDVERLLAAGEGTIRMVTLAPERPGGIEACRLLAARGVVAAIGHTAADYETVVEALAAGASGATHLFNAMRPVHHRSPGPNVALLGNHGAALELIVDGIHLHPGLVSTVAGAHPERVVLVTDAMAAAGTSDGDYVLGTLAVQVRDGVARVAGTATIAGSTLTLAKAVRHAVEFGVDPVVALRSATSHGARWLGLDGVGDLVVGDQADLVTFDEAWNVTTVMRRGTWVVSP